MLEQRQWWGRTVATDVLFVSEIDPLWVIKEEAETSTGKMKSYPYHLKCEDKDDCHGWVSAWDTRNGEGYHCKGKVPEDITTLWQLQNSEVLGGFMYEVSEVDLGEPDFTRYPGVKK
jgi:hypothetical protein